MFLRTLCTNYSKNPKDTGVHALYVTKTHMHTIFQYFNNNKQEINNNISNNKMYLQTPWVPSIRSRNWSNVSKLILFIGFKWLYAETHTSLKFLCTWTILLPFERTPFGIRCAGQWLFRVRGDGSFATSSGDRNARNTDSLVCVSYSLLPFRSI